MGWGGGLLVVFHSVLTPPSLGLLQFVPETLISLLPPPLSTLFHISFGVVSWFHKTVNISLYLDI